MLFQDPGESSIKSREQRRLDRLTFWSVLILDYSLSFGVGRTTALPTTCITQTLPTDEDVCTQPGTRHPFPYTARQMLSFGELINVLNRPHDGDGVWLRKAQAGIHQAMTIYNALPPDMQWNTSK